ncbi:MAG TPA: hypothetical protein VK846_11090 [Candidatus Limnocylindria bacterium]|nr:hypothetical protein [Candidatus Limnocylindria bacterium]
MDILLPKHKIAIFAHGCFWNQPPGYKNCTTPTNRREWWVAKLEGNTIRNEADGSTVTTFARHRLLRIVMSTATPACLAM